MHSDGLALFRGTAMKFRLVLVLLCGALCLSGAAHAQDPKDAREWFAFNQKAFPSAKHLVVDVELRTGETEYVRYQVDRTPELWRIHMRDGDTFVGIPRKPWLKSEDWGYTGIPVAWRYSVARR